MSWQTALSDRCEDGAALVPLIGARSYWIELPQGVLLPALVMTTISDARNQLLKGFDSIQPARVQIDAYGETAASARAVMDAAIADLVPAATVSGIVFARAMVDLPPREIAERRAEKTVRRITADLVFHHANET